MVTKLIEHSGKKVQTMLYATSFLTYGIGDASTAVYMMKLKGIGIEANLLIRHIIESQGFFGFVTFKLWITFTILAIPFIMQFMSKERLDWTINGFLASITIGGALAMMANLIAARGGTPPLSAGGVILVFVILVIVLSHIGGELDDRIYGRIDSKKRYARDFTVDGDLIKREY